MPTEPTSETELVSQILVLVGRDPAAILQPGDAPRKICFARPRASSCSTARSDWGWPASRSSPRTTWPCAAFEVAFEGLRAGRRAGREGNGSGNGHDTVPARTAAGSLPQKFDLGPGDEPADEVAPSNIPWGYGHDRVTAMVVDPERLFVYWEVTDDAVAAARARARAAAARAPG